MIALLLLSIVPHDDIVRDRCEVIEHNGFYDDQGHLVFDQLIFYDWSPERSRYQVRAWRLLKAQSQLPEFVNGQWRCQWLDGETTRCVTAPSYRRTWTQFDPELAERDVYPKEKRRELRK